MTALIVAGWLAFGYLFTYWFVNHFLDDKKFSDQPQQVGPGWLIMLTLVGPMMAGIMLVFFVVDVLIAKTGPTIKRMYGVK